MEEKNIMVLLFAVCSLTVCKVNGPPVIELLLVSPPVVGEDVSFRCTTEHIPSATIEYYLENYRMATIVYPCNVTFSKFYVSCSTEGAKSHYTLTVNNFSINKRGMWSCQYYAGTAVYYLQNQYMTHHEKDYIFTNISDEVEMRWPSITPLSSSSSSPSAGISLMDPSGSVVLNVNNSNAIEHWYGNLSGRMNFTGNVTESLISTRLHDVKKADNGTYMVIYGSQRVGVTLIVLDKPMIPVITEVKSSFISDMAEVTVSCIALSQSAAPSYYSPTMLYHWQQPGYKHYETIKNSGLLTIYNINCKLNHSLPVFCFATENGSTASPKQHYFPNSVCPDPVTVPPSGAAEEEEDNRLLYVLVIAGMCLTLALIWIILGRRRVGKCCSRSTKLLVKCCIGIGTLCGHIKCCKCCRKKDEWLDYDDIFNVNHLRPISMRPPVSFSEALGLSVDGDRNIEEDDDHDFLGRLRALSTPQGNFSNNIGLSSDRNTPEEPVAGAVGGEVTTNLRHSVAQDLDTAIISLRRTLSEDTVDIQVRREGIVADLMAFYNEPEIVGKSINVEYIGEAGFDLGGVTADMFTTFWIKVAEVYFRGHEALVPYLPPHRLGEELNYILLGRIYTHSTAVLGYVPVQLCRSTVMVLVYNDPNVDEDVLLEDFLMYLDEIDRELILAGLKDFSSLSELILEELQELFIRFEMGCVLKEDTFKSHVINMARNELCIKPRSLCEMMRRGIPDGHLEYFWFRLTVDELNVLYTFLKPSVGKVLSKLRSLHSLNSDQRRVFTYLKDFIKGLDTGELEVFLQYVTGHRSVPVHPIVVEFMSLSGIQRRPIAHTCGNVLEVSVTYDTFQEFQTEFTNLLSSDDAMRMDMK